MNRIVVIAGTVDARQIISELLELRFTVTATVTSRHGHQLLEDREGLTVRMGRMTTADFESLIEADQPCCLVDASHPFATEVSEHVITACNITGTPYLRYEREECLSVSQNVIRVADFEEAAEAAARFTGKIFLAIGSKRLNTFTAKITDFKERLIVRVLPDSEVIAACESMGLPAGNIIAMQGPFTEELNTAMLKQNRAAVLVTKESGEPGGTSAKIQAAVGLGIPVVLIERPKIAYPRQCGTVAEVMEFVRAFHKFEF